MTRYVGCAQPSYEDALDFGAEHPEAQRRLAGFDDPFGPEHRFAFVAPE